MQFILGSATRANSCEGAKPLVTPPVVHGRKLAIAAGSGDVAAQLYVAASGEALPYGGVVTKNMGCFGLSVLVSYLSAKDCSACGVGPYDQTSVTIDVPAEAQGIQLPEGYIAFIEVQTMSPQGQAVPLTQDGEVRFTSSRRGVCGIDVTLPLDGAEP